LPVGRGDPAQKREQSQRLLDGVYDWLPPVLVEHGWDVIDDVQVICARNNTRKELTRLLQARLNPHGVRGPGGFRVGDKVVTLRNGIFGCADRKGREYVANGDIGRVESFRGRQMLVRLSCPTRTVAVPLARQADTDGEAGANGEEQPPPGGWDL